MQTCAICAVTSLLWRGAGQEEDFFLFLLFLFFLCNRLACLCALYHVDEVADSIDRAVRSVLRLVSCGVMLDEKRISFFFFFFFVIGSRCVCVCWAIQMRWDMHADEYSFNRSALASDCPYTWGPGVIANCPGTVSLASSTSEQFNVSLMFGDVQDLDTTAGGSTP